MGKRGRWGTVCKHCHQPISAEYAAEREALKGERVRQRLKARKDAGLPIGRKNRRPVAEIHRLRALGLSIRQIAIRIGMTTCPVQLALKELPPQGGAEGAEDELVRRLYYKVKKHMRWDDEKTLLWFRTKNPNLGGVTPDDFIARRPDKAEMIIDSMIAGEGP